MATNVPGGGLASPERSDPQQTAVPSVRMPHACAAPASIAPTRVVVFARPSAVSPGTGIDPARAGRMTATLTHNDRMIDKVSFLLGVISISGDGVNGSRDGPRLGPDVTEKTTLPFDRRLTGEENSQA